MKLDPDVEKAFEKLYNENGVTLVGEWIDQNDPTTLIMMTGYKDEEHYKSFIEKAKQNELYIKFNNMISENRLSIEMMTLVSNTNE